MLAPQPGLHSVQVMQHEADVGARAGRDGAVLGEERVRVEGGVGGGVVEVGGEEREGLGGGDPVGGVGAVRGEGGGHVVGGFVQVFLGSRVFLR